VKSVTKPQPGSALKACGPFHLLQSVVYSSHKYSGATNSCSIGRNRVDLSTSARPDLDHFCKPGCCGDSYDAPHCKHREFQAVDH